MFVVFLQCYNYTQRIRLCQIFRGSTYSRDMLRERGSSLNEDKTLHLRCHRDRMGVTLFNLPVVPEYAQEVAFDERSES